MESANSLTRREASDRGIQARVSVALCTYNGAAFLGEQLESIAQQTLQPFELIVCDDVSSDATVAILEQFRARVPFPVMIEVNPETLGSRRNFEKALRLCSGEFIALCDQDDRWESSKLDRLVALLKDDPQALGSFSNASLMDARSQPVEGTLWKRFRFWESTQERFRGDPVGLLLKHDVVTGCMLVMRRTVLDSFESIGESWLHDGWLTWMIVLHGRMLLLPELLATYRLHAGQETGAGGQAFRDRVKTIRRETRGRYRRMAAKAKQLAHYIDTHRPRDAWIAAAWRKKGAFMTQRAGLSSNPFARLWFLLLHWNDYHTYARGFRSMSKDLVL